MQDLENGMEMEKSWSNSSMNILVVDDDPGIADILEDMLQDLDYRVECAANGVEALERLAENLEKKRDFSKKITGAMIYPAIVVVGMGLVAFVMMVFVIPKLMTLYEEFQVELPISTKILMFVSKFMSRYWWLAIAGAVGGALFSQIAARL